MQYNALAYHRMACIFFAKVGSCVLKGCNLSYLVKVELTEFKAESYD